MTADYVVFSVTEISVTEVTARHVQTGRPRAGHARSAAVENPRARADARLGDRPAVEADLRRRSAGQRRFALPRAPQTRTARPDHRNLEEERPGPSREVLLPDAQRP